MTIFKKGDHGVTRDGRPYVITDTAGHILYVIIDGGNCRHYSDGTYWDQHIPHELDLMPPTHNEDSYDYRP